MWLNLKSRIQIIYRIALVIRTGRQKFGLLYKLYSNYIFINATLIKTHSAARIYDVSVRHVTIIK